MVWNCVQLTSFYMRDYFQMLARIDIVCIRVDREQWNPRVCNLFFLSCQYTVLIVDL